MSFSLFVYVYFESKIFNKRLSQQSVATDEYDICFAEKQNTLKNTGKIKRDKYKCEMHQEFSILDVCGNPR